MGNLAPALLLPLVIGRYPVRTWAGTSPILTEICRYLCQSFQTIAERACLKSGHDRSLPLSLQYSIYQPSDISRLYTTRYWELH